MGARKTSLARGDRYGLLKATELAAEMIGQYERGLDGVRELRVESLEEAIWDDIVTTDGTNSDGCGSHGTHDSPSFHAAERRLEARNG